MSVLHARAASWKRLRGVAAAAHLTGKRVLGALGLGVTLAGLYHFYWPIVTGPPKPTPLSGDLNVGVATLVAAEGTDQDYAKGLSESLFRAIRDDVRRLSSGGGIELQVGSPERVGAVDGQSAPERLEAAQELSRDLNAHVLLYGVVAIGKDGVELRPEFAFAQPLRHPEDRQVLVTATQVPPSPSEGESFGVIRETGTHAAGVTARARVRERAVKRARAFASFIVGLSHYARALELRAEGARASGDLHEAARWFDVSRRAGWDPDAAHVLHLFRGNVALLRGKMNAAGAEYTRALRFRSDYARAQLGLAEVRFHQAIPACASGSVPSALREAARRYRAVLARTGPPLLETKAQYGLGRAAFCASQWGVAERAFHAVVATYDRGFRDARAQAAGALGGLGLVALQRPGGGRPDLKAAERDLKRAIELTPPSPEQGGLFALLGYAHASLGQRRAALGAYREAMRLDPRAATEYATEAEELLGKSPEPGGSP